MKKFPCGFGAGMIFFSSRLVEIFYLAKITRCFVALVFAYLIGQGLIGVELMLIVFDLQFTISPLSNV
ncbi:MAG: hypothetical protein LBQ66_07855 [Planctomycetaceae bacterium]|nr:hypothetical protein [Planctomycetaceae bacterium]